MREVALTVNERAVSAPVPPRTNLADYLRESLALTGTHVGCEHGVCGACTVLIDGVPARSCITLAAACEGAHVTTIEGLEDAVTDALRDAFARHHGLQCGFCTPAMLVTARDIVMRLPDADETRIRAELSGNLCRCTGYVGIVRAIEEVLANPPAAGPAPARDLGPVGARTAAVGAAAMSAPAAAATEDTTPGDMDLDAHDWDAVMRDGTALTQTFEVDHPAASVWQFFADIEAVAACLPGAHLTEMGAPAAGRLPVSGVMRVKIGPIVSAFAGTADIETDDAARRGTVRGTGQDAKSQSRARAIIRYTVTEAGASQTAVEVRVIYALTGTLAQIGRSGLIRDVADHITTTFAENLEARLSGRETGEPAADVLDAGSAAGSVLKRRLARFFARIFRTG